MPTTTLKRFCRYKGFPNSQAKFGQDDSWMRVIDEIMGRPVGRAPVGQLR
jgi:hypothetical protein